MIRSSELTNGELRSYKEEYDRLFMERKRLDLHIDAILTTAAIKLEKIYNTTRLDYAHLSNAYLAYTQNGLDSMQFKIVDTTVRDLFFINERDFKFVSIEPYESGAYEFIYQYNGVTISIKIPVSQTIDKDNIDNLEWGLFTVYDIKKRTDLVTEKVVIIRSDNTEIIKTTLMNYLNPSDDLGTDSN